jgi:hypothetical protein
MQENEQKRNIYMSMVAQENQAKMLSTKRQERIAILKKQELVSKKQREGREELDKQIEQEERLIKQKEQEVMEMELLEMELIKKLQSTQAIQKEAYAELEEVLQSKPTVQGYNSQQPFSAGSPLMHQEE